MLANPTRTEWKLDEPTAKLEACTIVFQTFIFMQLFSFINFSKLGEYNVFAGLLANWKLLSFIIQMMGLQILIVAFGGRFMQTYPLSVKEHALSVAIASTTLIWGFLFKLVVPVRCFNKSDATAAAV